nr:immunoglobulin heavy chain junction region [Macaca mulatta]MOW76624.1 immunoglobulin heavy chain junction region [Macaca mulatta]MOW77186.1 immunoglobulin heavy chain junction region [Macaca mulatta]MOW77912.1 immunoglobulin heavy chain junction region [Macaca mulatta]MOW78597.1 immunoglobulin heavy chain junction region [Macaca mulatta]
CTSGGVAASLDYW